MHEETDQELTARVFKEAVAEIAQVCKLAKADIPASTRLVYAHCLGAILLLREQLAVGAQARVARFETIEARLEAFDQWKAALAPPHDGIDGRHGVDGKDGKDIPLEVVKALVEGAVAERVASLPAAKDGRDGREGRDGKDAASIDILEKIHEARQYERGVVARHRGGLFRAHTTTTALKDCSDPLKAGWSCILNGISNEEETVQQEGRQILRTVHYSDGSSKTFTRVTSVLIDRGVHKFGKPYQRGDVVSYAGSMWICQRSTTTSPGGESWRLAVKSGRDGKRVDRITGEEELQ